MSSTLVVGQLVGVYGVKGWLKVKSFTEPAENLLQYAPWYLALPTGLKPVQVQQSSFRPQGLLVKLVGIDDRDQAALLGRAEIRVDAALLPELDEGDYYWSQLMGLVVLSDYNGQTYCLGRVRELLETGSNDVLVVEPFKTAAQTLDASLPLASMDDKERLIPYLPGQFVTQVDLNAGVIRVEWDPEF